MPSRVAPPEAPPLGAVLGGLGRCIQVVATMNARGAAFEALPLWLVTVESPYAAGGAHSRRDLSRRRDASVTDKKSNR
jgi:hypothetical protein